MKPFSAVLCALALPVAMALPSGDTSQVRKSLDPIPAGSPDGTYLGDFDEDGNTVWTYLGPAPTNITIPAVSPASSDLTTRAAQGTYCTGSWISSTGAETAIYQFLYMCQGGGLTWTGRSVGQSAGGVLAYGCNYGNGQTTYATQVSQFFQNIQHNCGQSTSGWYSMPEWRASYGLAPAGTSVC